MTNKPCSTAAILLAAGGSKRLGQPKQLLPMGPRTLLAQTLQAVVATPNLCATFVVLGANADHIRSEIDFDSAEVVLNPQWAQGLSSSLQAGIRTAQKWKPDLDAVLFTLADQPYLTSAALEKLAALGHNSRGTIKLVTSFYQGHPGAPCWAHASIFEQIMNLEGDQGLKPLFKLLPATQIKHVDLPELAIDIDTKEDYRRVLDQPVHPPTSLD